MFLWTGKWEGSDRDTETMAGAISDEEICVERDPSTFSAAAAVSDQGTGADFQAANFAVSEEDKVTAFTTILLLIITTG